MTRKIIRRVILQFSQYRQLLVDIGFPRRTHPAASCHVTREEEMQSHLLPRKGWVGQGTRSQTRKVMEPIQVCFKDSRPATYPSRTCCPDTAAQQEEFLKFKHFGQT